MTDLQRLFRYNYDESAIIRRISLYLRNDIPSSSFRFYYTLLTHAFEQISKHTNLLFFSFIPWQHILQIFVYTISLGTFTVSIAEIL